MWAPEPLLSEHGRHRWSGEEWGLLSALVWPVLPPGSRRTCTPCLGSDPDTKYPTFSKLVVGSDHHSPRHIADRHLNPRAVSEIHSQMQSCLGSHLHPEPQTGRRPSIRVWEATDSGVHRISRNVHGDGSRVTLSRGTELLGTRPAC